VGIGPTPFGHLVQFGIEALKMQDQKMQDLKMTEQIGFW
jgi:hypothetical protein